MVCKKKKKKSPTERDLMFLLVSCRFDSIFEEKFENVAMQALNWLGNRSSSLETGCHLYACLFPSSPLSLLHMLMHKPSAIQVLCDFTSRALSGCLHQLKICCRKTALIGTEGEEKQRGRTLHHIFETNACR